MTPRVLVVDGVTGAGKTSVITRLRESLPQQVHLIPEDDTLGNLMDQIRDDTWRAHPTFDALETVLTRIEAGLEADDRTCFLVERFHLTAYALFPEWKCYEDFDRRLHSVGASMVLLTFPDDVAEIRSIERPDREGWPAGMDEYYGSRAGAMRAVIESQRLRWNGLTLTRLPFLHIDTRRQDWQRCAAAILAYWTAG